MNKPTVNQQRLTVSKKFQLEQWDRLCPLTELERLSIQSIQRSIQSNISTNILQSHQSHQSSSSSSSSDSNTATQASSSSDCQTNNHQETIPPPSPSSSSTTSDRPIRPESNSKDEPIVISSISHFNDWFSSISDQIQADSEAQVLDHLSSISTYRRSCDRIESSIDRSSNLLESIRSDWNFIDLNSRSLESSSETILEDHKRLNLLACRLEERLNFFRCLEDFQKFLSLPGQDELISHPEFVPMIERLDQSLEFIKSNRHFRDADLYLVRFQQCLTRSMTLIKLYYSSQVQSLTESINFKLSQNSQSASILSPLVQSMLYQKFEGLSNQLFPLINQIERRFKVDKEEYGSILYEMFSTWFSVRNQLFGNFLKIEIRQMAIDHNQVPDLIRLGAVGCNFMRSICNSEYRLFRSMFKESGTEEVFSYLESLCDHLYDLLRPQILHEQRLEVLCALATSVNALIAMDSDLLDIEPHDAQNQTVVSDSFNFSLLLRPILQDIQTRLIFRAQSIIQTEVANYQPKKSDLDYPSKLIVSGDETAECGEARKGAPGEGSEEILIRSALRFRLPSEDVQQLWYPTLKKTLWVLSKLHTYVNDAIFEDFAGEAVGICSQTILNASKQILPSVYQDCTKNALQQEGVQREHGAGYERLVGKRVLEWLDGELFLIRNLLILKDMIKTIDVSKRFGDRAMDLNPLKEVLKDIIYDPRRSIIFRPGSTTSRFIERLNQKGKNRRGSGNGWRDLERKEEEDGRGFGKAEVDEKVELEGILRERIEGLIERVRSEILEQQDKKIANDDEHYIKEEDNYEDVENRKALLNNDREGEIEGLIFGRLDVYFGCLSERGTSYCEVLKEVKELILLRINN